MNPNKILVLVFGSAFLTIFAWCADKEEPRSPEELISRARSQEEIWVQGTPPMSIRAELQAFEIRALKDRKIIATVRVLETAKITDENPALFNVPANAEFWPQCDDMQEPELLDRVQPRYPTSARTNHEQGRVILYAVVEADGSLSHMAIIHRATPDLLSPA